MTETYFYLDDEFKYVFTQPLYEQDVSQSQFLSRVLLGWIQSFLISRLICIPRLKSPICSIIYLYWFCLRLWIIYLFKRIVKISFSTVYNWKS